MTTKQDARKEEREARTSALLKDLDAAIKDATKTENWMAWLKQCKMFRQYSINNQMLILIQSRGLASQVNSYKRWESLGRQVKRGEKALWIYAPCTSKKIVLNDDLEEEERKDLYFRLVPVFDVSQTEGAPLASPAKILDASIDARPCLDALIKIAGIPVTFKSMHEYGANGFFDPKNRRIQIASNRPDAQKIKTLAHEIAHSRLHADLSTKAMEHWEREVEAESVAYIISDYFGLDSSDYSAPYLASWIEEAPSDKKESQARMTRIRDCARAIMEELDMIQIDARNANEQAVEA